jgi:hypothetical protein
MLNSMSNNLQPAPGKQGLLDDLYISLLKKTLRFAFWEDPGKPISAVAYRAGFLAPVVLAVSSILEKFRLRIVVLQDKEMERQMPGSSWPACAHSMVAMPRLDNLIHAVRTVLKENIPGDLIETGVWRGGACILMKGVLAVHGDSSRRLFVADSFEGLPAPDAAKYPKDKGDKHHVHQFLAVSKEEVEENFRKYELLDERVIFLKGWFKDTLPTAPIKQLAVMRLDGDMYESTMDALTNLYPKLSPGGFCIIDDYGLPGCKLAVDDFRAQNKISEPLEQIDYGGSFWRKKLG